MLSIIAIHFYFILVLNYHVSIISDPRLLTLLFKDRGYNFSRTISVFLIPALILGTSYIPLTLCV